MSVSLVTVVALVAATTLAAAFDSSTKALPLVTFCQHNASVAKKDDCSTNCKTYRMDNDTCLTASSGYPSGTVIFQCEEPTDHEVVTAINFGKNVCSTRDSPYYFVKDQPLGYIQYSNYFNLVNNTNNNTQSLQFWQCYNSSGLKSYSPYKQPSMFNGCFLMAEGGPNTCITNTSGSQLEGSWVFTEPRRKQRTDVAVYGAMRSNGNCTGSVCSDCTNLGKIQKLRADECLWSGEDLYISVQCVAPGTSTQHHPPLTSAPKRHVAAAVRKFMTRDD